MIFGTTIGVLFSLAVIVFCIYLFYKQIQFIIVSVNLYKEMVKQNSTMIEILLEIRDQTKNVNRTDSRNKLDDVSKIDNLPINSIIKLEKNTVDKKLIKTELIHNVKVNSIIQGKILKILNSTIIVAHNDDANDIIEVKNYPTDKIVDEVWVKIKVKYLYSNSNLTQIVEFIETVEQF